MDTLVQLSRLQLEGYYVKELSFRIRDDLDDKTNTQMQVGVGLQVEGLFNPDPLTVNIQTGIARHSEDPFRWKCMVRVESQNPPERRYPYDFLAVLIGFFKMDERISLEEVEALIKINGASVLYSAAREALASATGRGPFPSVLLPTAIFVPQVEQEQKQLTAAPEENVGAKGNKVIKKKPSKKVAKKKS